MISDTTVCTDTMIQSHGTTVCAGVQIKNSLEGTAAASLSLADIIVLAPAYGLGKMGGGDYMPLMKVGRVDASGEDPTWQDQLPAPSLDVPGLKENFARKGFSTREMVVLSGSHTVRVRRSQSQGASSTQRTIFKCSCLS